jgi:hypothetical protein
MRNYKRTHLLSGWLYIIIWVLCLYGWFANIYKLTQCDFDVPLKAEVTRGIGVVIFPVGIVMGYMDIEDTKK